MVFHKKLHCRLIDKVSIRESDRLIEMFHNVLKAISSTNLDNMVS